MNKENTQYLFEHFKFFKPEKGLQESLMKFGFECHDGWFELIKRLCEDIEIELNKKENINLKKSFEVVQVKEKFGGLRFYTGPTKDKIFKLIDKAEEESYHICEECGKKGVLRNVNNWYLTLCLKHYKERKLIKLRNS